MLLIDHFVCSSNAFPIPFFQDWKLEKKSSDIFNPNNSSDNNGGNINSEPQIDEEAPLIASSRLSHIGRTQVSNHGV